MIDSKIRSPAVIQAPAPPSAAASTLPAHVSQPVVAAHPFAEMLRQNRLAAATSTTPTAQKTAAAKAGEAQAPAEGGSEATPVDAATAQREPASAKARAAASARATARSSADQTTTVAKPADDTPAHDAATKDTPPADPTQNAATIANAQAAAALSIDGRADDLAAAARAESATADDLLRGRDAANAGQSTMPPFGIGPSPGAPLTGATSDRGLAALVAGEVTANGDAAIDKDVAAATTGSFAGLLAETRGPHATASPLDGASGAASTQAAAQTAFGGSATPSTAAAAASAALPTPVHSAEFAAAFGLQVSALAKDGVQHAELHLNPADMGPVSIRITLDGSQARVDFGADVAATRHAIEAGLPELASAMRDAGFTLAGGGVAQHSASNGGQGGDADPGSNRGASSSRLSSTQVAGIDAAAQRRARAAAAGGIDLYV
ncbi:MAG: flagellar hook-length control protein FliK [Caldimonas sp.]